MKAKVVSFTRTGLAKLGKMVRIARTTLVYEGSIGVSYRKFQAITGLSHSTIHQIELAADLEKENVNKSVEYETLAVLSPFLGYETEELIRVCGGAAQLDIRKDKLCDSINSDGNHRTTVLSEELWGFLDQMTPDEILQLVVTVVKKSRFNQEQLAVLLKVMAESMSQNKNDRPMDTPDNL